MIQRIQSLLLFIAAAISVVVCFINVGHIDQQVGGELVKYYQFDSFTLQKLDSNNQLVSVMHTTYIALLWIASAILSLVTIFFYKKRTLQIRLNGINMLVMLAALVVMLYVYPNLVFEKQEWFKQGMMVNFNYWITMSLVPAVCLFFANRAIKSDEKKVRSADRLR